MLHDLGWQSLDGRRQDQRLDIFYNNNNNNRVYTPLSEKCSQSRVFISQCHMNHIIQYSLCVLTSMVHVALKQITAQYQIQISDENTCIHSNTDTRVTNITVE